jgi:hypothetical protein
MAWEYLKANAAAIANNRDILIATPHKGTVTYHWAMSIRHLNIPDGLSFATVGETGQPIDIARNILITNALRLNAKYIFFVDSDIIIYPDTLVTLHRHQLPMVSAAYISRSEPYHVIASMKK